MRLVVQYVDERQAICKPCQESILGPNGLKWYCGLKWNKKMRDMQQEAGLVKLTENPESECPLGYWGKATGPQKLIKKGASVEPEATAQSKEALKTFQDERYRELWVQFHKRPSEYKSYPESDVIWIKAFIILIRCPYCIEHFNLLLTEYPPNFESEQKYFEWTVFIHDKVNDRLDKERFGINNARRVYYPELT